MKSPTLDEAVVLCARYQEIEARANKVLLDVNTVYLWDKLMRMKVLLRNFSVFASEVSKAMLSIADDIKRVMAINEHLFRPLKDGRPGRKPRPPQNP